MRESILRGADRFDAPESFFSSLLSVRPSALGGYRRGVVTRILTVEDVFELGTYHRLSARRGA